MYKDLYISDSEQDFIEKDTIVSLDQNKLIEKDNIVFLDQGKHRKYQSDFIKDTMLLYENKVYKICNINFDDIPYLSLEKIIKNVLDIHNNYITINFKDIRIDKYKKIENVQELSACLLKEFENMKIKYIEDKKHLKIRLEDYVKRKYYFDEKITEIRTKCYDECSSDMKSISKDCDHNILIIDHQESIECLELDIDYLDNEIDCLTYVYLKMYETIKEYNLLVNYD